MFKCLEREVQKLKATGQTGEDGRIFGLGSIFHLLQLALACTFASIAGGAPDCDLMSEIALTGSG